MAAKVRTTKGYEARVRVAAPVDQVWDEVGTLPQVLRYSEAFVVVEPSTEGDSARVVGAVTWGLKRWELAGEVTVIAMGPGRALRWVGEVTRLGLQVSCALDVQEVPGDRTELRYGAQAQLTRRTPVAAAMWNALSAELETYVGQFVHTVATSCERHARARRQLGDQ